MLTRNAAQVIARMASNKDNDQSLQKAWAVDSLATALEQSLYGTRSPQVRLARVARLAAWWTRC